MTRKAYEDYGDNDRFWLGSGYASNLNDYARTPTVKREFWIGFEGANPGPSWEEPKPVFRVKARTRPL